MIKFIHLRMKDEHGINPLGGMTIAYVLENEQVIGFAPAKCHERDNYVKYKGRAKAEGRLKSDRYFTEVSLPEQDFFLEMQRMWEIEQKTTAQNCRCSRSSQTGSGRSCLS